MFRLALAALLASAVAGCGGPVAEGDVSGLTLKSRGTAYPVLTGYVVNKGDVAITSADVSVTLYDADNMPMEELMVGVRRVEVGDSARFTQRLDLPARAVKLKYLGVN